MWCMSIKWTCTPCTPCSARPGHVRLNTANEPSSWRSPPQFLRPLFEAAIHSCSKTHQKIWSLDLISQVFQRKSSQIYITSVSGWLCFTFKTCQIIAGASMIRQFHEFLSPRYPHSDFYIHLRPVRPVRPVRPSRPKLITYVPNSTHNTVKIYR